MALPKHITITIFNDPGHGWYRVPRTLLEELGIIGQITTFSYQKGQWVYCEEDQDAHTLITALEAAKVPFKTIEKYAKGKSKIRDYNHFDNPDLPVAPPKASKPLVTTRRSI